MEFILRIIALESLFVLVAGHGRLIEPPGRSTMWRYGFHTPVNSDDHALSCGGYGVQYSVNGGKCGICGDRYDGERQNEAGGLYATGTIARAYKSGDVITVKLEITVNHGGWFEFRICPNNDVKKRATQECLDKYLLKQTNGETRYNFPGGPSGIYSVQLQLPKELTCSQCVLQWKWNTASNTACDGSKCCRGCGNQEQFYGCSDVSIQGNINSPVLPYVGNQPNAGQKPNIGILPTNTNTGNGFVPGSFVPIGGNNNIPSVPENGNNQECKATRQFQLQIPLADQWCQMNCKHGNSCPKSQCEDGCRGINNNCKAKPFWRARFASPTDGDKWCSDRCSSGPCPLEYCEQECWRRR